MLKKDLFSDKIYLSNILRNMLSSGIGFLIVWIWFIIFETRRTEEDVFIAGVLIFFLFSVLSYLTSILENSLFLLMRKKRLLPFLITYSSLIMILVYTLFCYSNELLLKISAPFLIFISLQTIGYIYQRKKERIGQSYLSKE